MATSSSAMSSWCAEALWHQCRDALTQAVFNSTTTSSGRDGLEVPQLPRRQRPTAFECDGRARAVDLRAKCTLTWSLDEQYDAPPVSMHSTVYWTLSAIDRRGTQQQQQQHQQQQAPPGATSRFRHENRTNSDTVILFHHGHEVLFRCGSDMPLSTGDHGTIDHLNTLGYDAIELFPPLYGCNTNTSSLDERLLKRNYSDHSISRHEAFLHYETALGDATMRYFLLPLLLTVLHCKEVLLYKHVVLVGLSGGAWATTIGAAMLPPHLSALSIPVAGSLPRWPTRGWPHSIPSQPETQRNEQKHRISDYEQRKDRPMYRVVEGFAELYVLGALEPDKYQLQILHEDDICCFRAAPYHEQIRSYNAYVQRHTAGWMQTAVTEGSNHDVNLRDRVLIATMVEALRQGTLSKATFAKLPFDLLRQSSTTTSATASARSVLAEPKGAMGSSANHSGGGHHGGHHHSHGGS